MKAGKGATFLADSIPRNYRFGIHSAHPPHQAHQPDWARGPQVGAREPCAHFPDDARSTRQTPSNDLVCACVDACVGACAGACVGQKIPRFTNSPAFETVFDVRIHCVCAEEKKSRAHGHGFGTSKSPAPESKFRRFRTGATFFGRFQY